MSTVRHIENLRKIFAAGIEAVKPENLFINNTSIFSYTSDKEELQIQNKKFPLKGKNVHVVGFGKAVFQMAREMEKVFGNKLKSGIISVPTGTVHKFAKSHPVLLEVYEGAEHNLPDRKAMEAAKKIMDFSASMTPSDVLIVLISGGGSALLPLPKGGISLEEKVSLIKRLQQKGVDIKDLNTVRIELSSTKGGQLAQVARNASQIIALIISDIVTDPIDLIASGPTVEKPKDNYKRAETILKKYGMSEGLHFKRCTISDDFSNVHNFVLGSNTLATKASSDKCKDFGYRPFIVTNSLEGEIHTVAGDYSRLLEAIVEYRNKPLAQFPDFVDSSKLLEFLDANEEETVCLIIGGETTVEIQGSGVGGRSQELSLLMSKEFKENPKLQNCIFLAAGTDGIDGPTDVAGAIGHSSVFTTKCLDALKNNDSYNFYKDFKGGEYHVKTGHTGTNVMDLHLILIPNKS